MEIRLKQDLQKLLEDILQHTTFDMADLGTISPELFRAKYLANSVNGDSVVDRAKPNVPKKQLATLIDRLYPLVQPYIDPQIDRIKYGIVGQLGGTILPTIQDFSSNLIRASAALTPNKAIHYFVNCLEGKPIAFRFKSNSPRC